MTNDTEKPIDVNDPFARRLILQYLGRRRDETSILRSALANGHFDKIRITGHNLSGSGSAYGLARVSELGAGLESAAKGRNSAEIARLIEELDRYVSSLRLT
ncbi:MAG: Hpt domain-containing protein [Woeseiaceae bacterium]